MSDDLVKRLRDMSNYYNSGGRFVAADRIEELEAKLAKAVRCAEMLYYGAGVVTNDMHATLAELKGETGEG